MATDTSLEYMKQLEASNMASQQIQQQQVDDFSKWRLDTETLITETEHELKGEEWVEWEEDGVKHKQWIKRRESVMNDLGVSFVVGMMRKALNKNIFLSKFTDAEVFMMSHVFHYSLCKKIFQNWVRWEFKKEYGTIDEDIAMAVFAAYKRALGEGERIALRQQERVIRSYSDSPQQQRGWNILPFSKGGDGK